MAALRAIKPVIAKLPESQRRAASDAAVKEIRGVLKMNPKPATNSYAQIVKAVNDAKKASSDSVDDREYGRLIMSKYNANHRKDNA